VERGYARPGKPESGNCNFRPDADDDRQSEKGTAEPMSVASRYWSDRAGRAAAGDRDELTGALAGRPNKGPVGGYNS